MALEALNHIGDEKKNVTVILNDNEMSIAKNVGALHGALARMRSAGKYNRAKDDLEWIMKKIPAVGGKIAQVAERLKDSMKYFVVPGMFLRNWDLLILVLWTGMISTTLSKISNMRRKQMVLSSSMS